MPGSWKSWLYQKFARFVLFRLIEKCSFNLLCVLDLFSERWQSTLFQIFFFFLVLISEKVLTDVSHDDIFTLAPVSKEQKTTRARQKFSVSYPRNSPLTPWQYVLSITTKSSSNWNVIQPGLVLHPVQKPWRERILTCGHANFTLY